MRARELDDRCAWCDFDGRESRTFAYHVSRGVAHWCSWHQSEVPPMRGTSREDRIPPAAQLITDLPRPKR